MTLPKQSPCTNVEPKATLLAVPRATATHDLKHGGFRPASSAAKMSARLVLSGGAEEGGVPC